MFFPLGSYLSVLTNGKVTRDKLGAHADLLDENSPMRGHRTTRR
jgi:hypothetical protein